MTESEMRELDAFCAKSVLGLRAVKTVMVIEAGMFALVRHGENKGTVFVHECMNNIKPFKPTVNPADAMQVLEVCAEKCGTVQVYCGSVCFEVFDSHRSSTNNGVAATLPLAIVMFAKQLFSK